MSRTTDKKEHLLGINSLPDTPGVYFFMEGKEILYIGKATSLRFRVKSYFSQDIAVTRGPKIVAMLQKATEVKWQTTDSVLEALLLESRLIKKHQPTYNTDEKDDKSFYFVVITKEDFPRVLLVRGRDILHTGHTELVSVSRAKRGYLPKSTILKQVQNDIPIKYLFGPFPQGGSLKEALKIVRKIFPFRDTCTPAQFSSEGGAVISGKPCFNAQLGLCPGVCSGAIDKAGYAIIIRHIKLFFEGKKSTIVRMLEKEMGECAKRLEFEKAQSIKKTLFALGHIYDVSLLKKETSESLGSASAVFRIEAYDVAHLSGKDVVGVMTVLEDGVPNTNEYRQFKLKTETNNDIGNLSEILTRRLQHSEWRFPDLIVVDGFDLQIATAHRILDALDISIPVVGVVKDTHHNPKGILGESAMAEIHHDAILLANSEAHRFAIAYHRKRRAKSFLS